MDGLHLWSHCQMTFDTAVSDLSSSQFKTRMKKVAAQDWWRLTIRPVNGDETSCLIGSLRPSAVTNQRKRWIQRFFSLRYTLDKPHLVDRKQFTELFLDNHALLSEGNSVLSGGFWNQPHKWTEELRIGWWKDYYVEHCGSETLQPSNRFKIADIIIP